MKSDRQVLGRGLDQLLGRTETRQIKQPSLDRVLQLRIDHVYPDPHQPRKFFDPHSIEELAHSIEEQGLIQPIVVSKQSDTHFVIVAGERRWRAFQKLGKDRIPAIIAKDISKQDKRTLMALVENIQRQNLNPIEEAKAFKKLLDDKEWSQQVLAEKIGRDRSSVANTLRLLQLHSEAQKLLEQNKISLSIAKLLLQESSKEKQKIWARQAYYEKWTVRDLEKKLKENTTKIKMTARDPQPLWLQEGCDRLSKKWNLDVSLRKSAMIISFSDPEQLKDFMSHV